MTFSGLKWPPFVESIRVTAWRSWSLSKQKWHSIESWLVHGDPHVMAYYKLRVGSFSCHQKQQITRVKWSLLKFVDSIFTTMKRHEKQAVLLTFLTKHPGKELMMRQSISWAMTPNLNKSVIWEELSSFQDTDSLNSHGRKWNQHRTFWRIPGKSITYPNNHGIFCRVQNHDS